jgi:hypothetical protein
METDGFLYRAQKTSYTPGTLCEIRFLNLYGFNPPQAVSALPLVREGRFEPLGV